VSVTDDPVAAGFAADAGGVDGMGEPAASPATGGARNGTGAGSEAADSDAAPSGGGLSARSTGLTGVMGARGGRGSSLLASLGIMAPAGSGSSGSTLLPPRPSTSIEGDRDPHARRSIAALHTRLQMRALLQADEQLREEEERRERAASSRAGGGRSRRKSRSHKTGTGSAAGGGGASGRSASPSKAASKGVEAPSPAADTAVAAVAPTAGAIGSSPSDVVLTPRRQPPPPPIRLSVHDATASGLVISVPRVSGTDSHDHDGGRGSPNDVKPARHAHTAEPRQSHPRSLQRPHHDVFVRLDAHPPVGVPLQGCQCRDGAGGLPRPH